MKIVREALLDVLKVAKTGLGASGAIPAFSHFWFDKETVCAYDGGLGVAVVFKSELDCGVPGSVLFGLLSSSITKELEAKYINDKLDVKLGRSAMQLSTLEGDQRVWPFPEKAKNIAKLKLTAELLAGLKKAMIVRASTPTQVAHHGVTLIGGKDYLDLYTTDGHTLARVTVDVKVPAKFPRIVLPTPFVDAVLSHLEEGADLYINDDHLSAESENVTVCCNMLDAENATDLSALIDKLLPKKSAAVPLPQGLETGLERATILAAGQEPFVTVLVDAEKFELQAKYPLGKLEEKLKLEKPHKHGGEGRILAPEVLKVLPHASEFDLTEKVFVFSQSEDFLYLVSIRAPEK